MTKKKPRPVNLPEQLETERLILRRPQRDDAVAIFERYAQDEEVTRYLTWKPHQRVDETRQFLAEAETLWKAGKCANWVIVRRDGKLIVGMIGLLIDRFRAEAGYVIARPDWGKGYATEALRAVTSAALASEPIVRVAAFCDLENAASARVMEKAGMQKEGIIRRYLPSPNLGLGPRDANCFAMVRE